MFVFLFCFLIYPQLTYWSTLCVCPSHWSTPCRESGNSAALSASCYPTPRDWPCMCLLSHSTSSLWTATGQCALWVQWSLEIRMWTVVCWLCCRCIVYHLETRMRKDVCFGVIALTWLLSAVLASPLAIFREYGSLNLEPGHSIQVTTDTHHRHTNTLDCATSFSLGKHCSRN